ncbi:MAG: DNA/RNA nuclease SfsA [Myxococcota bacterium]
MNLPLPLSDGTLIRRYKRFLADVRLPDGRTVTAHCPNPGSMKTCAEAGWRVRMSHNNNPRRKLRWTLEMVYDERDLPILINTGRPNDIVAEALENKAIPDFASYTRIRREVRYGDEKSRIDFLMTDDNLPDCYIEVKNVTLKAGPDLAAFPDATTRRGQKHLRELMTQQKAGDRAVLLFLVSRGGMAAMRPADDIDPEYGRLLRAAATAGVEVRAHRLTFNGNDLSVGTEVPVHLD